MTKKFLVPVVLPADPTAALEAATKQYVDGKMVVTTWTALTMAGTWAGFGSGWNSAWYRKVGDEVQLRGLVKNTGTDVTIGTLPTGFRPPTPMMFAVFGAVNGEAYAGIIRIDVQATDGAVIISKLGNGFPTLASFFYVSLDGIRFSVTS